MILLRRVIVIGFYLLKMERGNNTRKQFFNQILDVVALLGGDVRDVR